MRKRSGPAPAEEEILAYDNVPVEVAARFIGWSTPTIYQALQDERAPFGCAARCKGGSWSYNISPGLLVKYKRGDLPTYRLREVQGLIAEGAEALLDVKLQGLKRVLDQVASA